MVIQSIKVYCQKCEPISNVENQKRTCANDKGTKIDPLNIYLVRFYMFFFWIWFLRSFLGNIPFTIASVVCVDSPFPFRDRFFQ